MPHTVREAIGTSAISVIVSTASQRLCYSAAFARNRKGCGIGQEKPMKSGAASRS